jgi:hypothetical protein
MMKDKPSLLRASESVSRTRCSVLHDAPEPVELPEVHSREKGTRNPALVVKAASMSFQDRHALEPRKKAV